MRVHAYTARLSHPRHPPVYTSWLASAAASTLNSFA